MERLDGKVAIITGGSRGIGRSTAQRLAADGASIVVGYGSSRAGAEDTVASITEEGSEALAVQADMADPGAVDRLFEAAATEFSGFDILVNNAGALVMGPVADAADADLERIFDITRLGHSEPCAMRRGPFDRVVVSSTSRPRSPDTAARTSPSIQRARVRLRSSQRSWRTSSQRDL